MILFNQIGAAVLLLMLTLWLQCAGVAALIEWLRRVLTRDTHSFRPIHAAILVVKSSVAVIVLHGLVIVVWTCWYRLRCFPSWELAFYFSSSTYTTLGSGDVALPSNWRLLGPLEAMTGVLMCGISVGVLFALVGRLLGRDTQTSQRNECLQIPSPVARPAAYSGDGIHTQSQHKSRTRVSRLRVTRLQGSDGQTPGWQAPPKNGCERDGIHTLY